MNVQGCDDESLFLSFGGGGDNGELFVSYLQVQAKLKVVASINFFCLH